MVLHLPQHFSFIEMNIFKFVLTLIILFSSTIIVGQGIPDSSFNTMIRTENGGWVAGDATYSIELPDGRTLWLFGDSFIGVVNPDSSLQPGSHMIRNCALIQEEMTCTAIYNGTFEYPEDFVETLNPDTTWYWPEHGLVENDTLKIIFSEFGPGDGTPGWNFAYRNAWLVFFTFPEIELIKQVKLPYFEQNGVMYGDRLLTHNGYTYVFGRKEETPGYHIPSPHVARVASGNLLGDWEFFDGMWWVNDSESSGKITDHAVSQQYGVFEHQDKFVLITQEIWLGTKIYSMVANQPEGPWSNVTVIYDTPHPFPDMFTYNAYSHPQFNENNELLVSYNSNGNFWQIFNNIELYRPNFFRIPFTAIHPSFTPTSIENQTKTNYNIICYPNPAKEKVTFEIRQSEFDMEKLQIYNINGVCVKEIKLLPDKNGNCKTELDISGFPKGLYIFVMNGIVGKFLHN